MIFHLQSARGTSEPHRQRLLGSKVQVISRSGLNLCESCLIEAFPSLAAGLTPKADFRTVTIGNRTGVLGQVACDVFTGQTTALTFDIHHHRSMVRNVLPAFSKRFHPLCQPDLPDNETYDLALLQLNRGNLSTELVHDLLQQVIQRLATGGRIACTIEGQSLWLRRRLQSSFRNVQIRELQSGLSLIVASECKGVGKPKSFRCDLNVTLPQGIAFPLVTYPGVFAHRRADAGGLALAETVDALPGDRVLDMGCGSGLIGIAIAKLALVEKLVLVDSHARAIQAAQENVRLNQIEAVTQVLQSDGQSADFETLASRFTLFVGNPPYYSQNQVTSRFVELSFHVLQSGGRAWFVTKNPEWLGKEIERYFGEVQYFSRRDYTLLRAVKP